MQSSRNEIFVEVRVPTFKRPELLRRALQSLVSQSFGRWKAIVFDDSPVREAEKVVSQFGESRVLYAPNSRNLGRVNNLNYCFRPEAFVVGATHACVLEDDNWYEPSWLEANVSSILHSGALVVARNYRLVDVLPDESVSDNPDPVMAGLHGQKQRWLSFEERLKECFFTYTLGNLAYFWKLNEGIDISMRAERFHVHVAESGRSVSFRQKCWFEPQPLANFSRFLDKRQTPSGETPHSLTGRRLAKISEIMFTRHLMRTWTRELRRPIHEIIDFAALRPGGLEAVQRLAEAGSLHALCYLRETKDRIASVKAWIVYILYRRAWRNSTSQTPLYEL